MGEVGLSELTAISSHGLLFCSLGANMLGPEGGKAIAEALKTNKTIKSIE